MTTEAFSLDGDGRLLRTIAAADYTFARFDRPASAARVFYFRHDVDVSPRMARAVGRTAAEAKYPGQLLPSGRCGLMCEAAP